MLGSNEGALVFQERAPATALFKKRHRAVGDHEEEYVCTKDGGSKTTKTQYSVSSIHYGVYKI